ncbi:lysylphosphatidylglycerol synthase transmembrane domain-containing protein [Chloroflexota bacterium]
MKRWLFVGLGLVVSAIFLFLGFRDLNFAQLGGVLQQISLGWVLLAALVYFAAAYIITWRWYYLLRPVKDVRPNRLFPLVIIGYMGNNVYPLRIGEVLRAYLLNVRDHAPIPATLTTILVERVFDGITMLALIFTALLFVDLDAPLIEGGIVALTVLFVVALLVFLALALRPDLARRLYGALFNRFAPERLRPNLLALADNLMDGLAALRHPSALLLVLILSLLSWTVEASTYWLVLQAFPFEVSFFVVLLIVGLGNLATILPTTPGYVGTFHGVVILVLLAFGVSQPEAAAYAIVMHAVIWLPVTVAGFILLVRMGLGWGDFAKAEQAVSAATKQS